MKLSSIRCSDRWFGGLVPSALVVDKLTMRATERLANAGHPHAGCSCSRSFDGNGGKASATATAARPRPEEAMNIQS